MHLAYCALVSELTHELMGRPGGICRWGSADSSEQGNFDLLYHGVTTMAVGDLVPRFRDALELIEQARLHSDAEPGFNASGAAGRLASALVIRAGVPVGVGSGHASLRHKAHALAHSTRLMCNSWREVAECLNRTCSWTGDLGTESGLTRFAESLRSLFGRWVVDSDHGTTGMTSGSDEDVHGFHFEDPASSDDGNGPEGFAFEGPSLVCNAEPDQADAADPSRLAGPQDFAFHPPPSALEPPEQPAQNDPAQPALRAEPPAPPPPVVYEENVHFEDPYEINGGTSMYIPGALHIVSNITKDMDKALTWFDTFVSYLTHICKMLSRKFTRNRFKAACLRSAAGQTHATAFDGFNAHVQRGRWGSVLHSVGALLQVEAPLRAHWSLQDYRAGGGARGMAESGDEDEGGPEGPTCNSNDLILP